MNHSTTKTLIEAFLAEVGNERLTTSRIVVFIREIDRRRAYLDYDCTSLFEFLLKFGKYSKSAAQRRIVAARMLADAPGLEQDLETGSLNISQTEQIARLWRQKFKNTKIDPRIAQQLLGEVKNKSSEETEKIVSQRLDIKAKKVEVAQVQADESVRREATFTKEEEATLRRVRDLISHTDPNPSFSELVMHMAQHFIAAKDPAAQAERRANKITLVKNQGSKSTAAVSARDRDEVFRRQKCCQWKFENGSLCGSTFRLEVDHVISRSKDGSNELVNLQLLCDVHNRLKYRKFG